MESDQIIHGRNLDYDFPEFLQNLTFIAEFHKNGEVTIHS